ncbi:hypothetical protein QUA41_31115 [Microcoleus sp. Pol11C1]|uniref:hypothetical protein n=1 Tax=Microcoleus TaxID=44471 RepID=UPI002FD0E6C5
MKIKVTDFIVFGTCAILCGTATITIPALSALDTSVEAITFYSYHDNNPPNSRAIKYPKVHKEAGGRGTYEDPITIAVPESFPAKPGTWLYVRGLQKYMIVEDLCGDSPCGDHGTQNFIDVWMESNEKNNKEVVKKCQEKWTKRTRDGDLPKAVVFDPPKNLPVNTTPFFDTKTNKCNEPPKGW